MNRLEEALDMIGKLERYRANQKEQTRKLQEAARIARDGNLEEARRLKNQVDRSITVFGGDVLPAMQTMAEHIKKLEDDCRFLLSWAPEDCPKRLSDTFYFTLSYEGDLKLQKRVDKIRAELNVKETGK